MVRLPKDKKAYTLQSLDPICLPLPSTHRKRTTMHQDTLVDPKSIIVRRDSRQRQVNISDIEDLKASIRATGVIQPIVVRQVPTEGLVLIAGERRLTAAMEVGLASVPVRVMYNISDEEAEVIELEENIKRKELHWRDHVRSVGRIHALYKAKHEGWTIGQTCSAIALSQAQFHKILRVFEAIDSPRIAHVEGIEQAYNTLSRFAERKAESIVSDIIANGAAIFGAAGQATTATSSSQDDFTVLSAISILDDTPPPPPSAEISPSETPGDTATNVVTLQTGTTVFPVVAAAPPPKPQDPVICANFLEWAAAYNGPKFTLIHCDFPYGNYRGDDSRNAMAGNASDAEDFYDNHEEIYWNLLDGLTANLDRIMSYSAHLMFWFNMNFYTETVRRLRIAGLFVHDHPLIWHKTEGGSGGRGVVPGNAVTYPRRTYDTALLAVRGKRPLARPGQNSYGAPTVGNKIHPSQKPEPMLRVFLSMLVDETTTVLDPTCGSGAALRAAEDLGAKSVLGLELDPSYANLANSKTLQARVMRQAGQLSRSE